MEAIHYEYNIHDRRVRLAHLHKACRVILENETTCKDVRAIGIIVDLSDNELSRSDSATKEEDTNSESIHSSSSNLHAEKCNRRLKLAGNDIWALHEWCKQFCKERSHKSMTRQVQTSEHNHNTQHAHTKREAAKTQENVDTIRTCSHAEPPHFFLIARIAPHSIKHLLMYMNWQTSMHAHKNSPLRDAHVIMLSFHHLSLLLSYDDNLTKHGLHKESLELVKQSSSKWGNLSQLLLHHQYLLFDTTWMISKEVEQEVELKEMAESHSNEKRKMTGKHCKSTNNYKYNEGKEQLIDLFFSQVYRKLHFPKHQCALWLSYNMFLLDCSNEYSSNLGNNYNNFDDKRAINYSNTSEYHFTEYMKRFRLLFTYLHKANTFSCTPQQRSENSFVWRLCCGYGGAVEDLCYDAMHLVLQSLLPPKTDLERKTEITQSAATEALFISSVHFINTNKTFHLRALRDVYALVSVMSGRDGADLYNDACTVCKHIYHRLCVAAELRKFKLPIVSFECKRIKQVTKELAAKHRVRIEELEHIHVTDTIKGERKRKRKRDLEPLQEKKVSKKPYIPAKSTSSDTNTNTSSVNEKNDDKSQFESSINSIPTKLVPLEWEESV